MRAGRKMLRQDGGRLLGPLVLATALLLLMFAYALSGRLNFLEAQQRAASRQIAPAVSLLSLSTDRLAALATPSTPEHERAGLAAVRADLLTLRESLRNQAASPELGGRAGTLLVAGIGIFGVILIGLTAAQIRGRINTETKLREGEARYRLLVEYASDVIFQTDLDLRREYVSPSVAAIFGYQPEELIGTTATKQFHPEDWPRVQEAYRALSRGGDFITLVARMRHRDDRWVWVEARNRLVRDAWGAPAKIIGIITDISARHAAEAALQASEASYRSLYVNAPAIIYTVDSSDRVLTVTDQALALFGYGRDEVIGRQSSEFMTRSARRAIPLTARPEFLATGGVVDVPAQFLTKSGAVRDVLLSAIAERDPAGSVRRTIVLVTDVTERKRLETALRNSDARARVIAENAGDVIFRFDSMGRCTFASPSYSRIFGYDVGEILEHDVGSAVVPEDRPRAQRTFAGMIKHKRPTLATFRGRHRDGRTLWLEANSSVICDRNTGAVAEVVSIVRDVTERHLANLRVEEARREAERANRAKSDFLATMSHELRTPMNGVLGFASILLESGLAPQQMRLAQRIQSSGEALLAIIDDILDLSKIEAGALTLEEIPFSLRETVNATIKAVAPKAAAKQLELSVGIDADAEDAVVGDPTRVRQVLLNLLSNAVKFTESGGVALRVARPGGPGNGVLRFEVSDSGIGIADDDQRLLFQPFSQVDGSITRRFGGAGLGLAISRRLLEAMPGGGIGVESQLGKGSCFWFTVSLPRADVTRDDSLRDIAPGSDVDFVPLS